MNDDEQLTWIFHMLNDNFTCCCDNDVGFRCELCLAIDFTHRLRKDLKELNTMRANLQRRPARKRRGA